VRAACEIFWLCCLQPVPVRQARGVIIGYRVHVFYQSHSWKLELNATDKPLLQLSELWTADDRVNLYVDARTSVGYNETLHIDVIHIRPFRHGTVVYVIFCSTCLLTVQAKFCACHPTNK